MLGSSFVDLAFRRVWNHQTHRSRMSSTSLRSMPSSALIYAEYQRCPKTSIQTLSYRNTKVSIIFVTVPRQSLQYKYTSAPQLYSFSCCAYAPYRSLNLTTHICYEALTAKRLRGFFSTLPLNASRQQSTRERSPTRTLNVSKRHPQGKVGTGVL